MGADNSPGAVGVVVERLEGRTVVCGAVAGSALDNSSTFQPPTL